jgi:hypothetical protein
MKGEAAASRKLKTSLNSSLNNIKVIKGSMKCEACYVPGHELGKKMHTKFCSESLKVTDLSEV